MYEFVRDDQMERLRGQLKDLLEVEDGLTGAEINFLEKCLEWEGNFTVGMGKWLDSIYTRVLG